MSTWTVDPEQIVSVLQTNLGRPVPVLDALLRIMAGMLSPTLDELGIPERAHPKSFHLAGEQLPEPGAKDRWPVLLVGGSMRTEEFGSGHQDELNVMVTIAWPPQISRREFQEALDVAAVVRGIMRHPNFAGRFVDPDDATRIIWGHCYPTGFRPVPANWPHYSGWMAEFIIRQFPNSGLWQATI